MASSDQIETAIQNGQSTKVDVESELALPALASFLSAHGFKLVAAAGVIAVLIALFTTRAEKKISALKEQYNQEKIAQAYDAGVLAGKEAGAAVLEASRANERAANAEERTGELAAETAKAEERTAKLEAANLELEKKLAPRRLDTDEVATLASSWARFRGGDRRSTLILNGRRSCHSGRANGCCAKVSRNQSARFANVFGIARSH
ncbi:hypothetical protein ACFOOP_18675 [Marinicaulis aureus]|uniref:Uncharacterized protein n=1 Tax=Hyphococcus aureus TaxID=2666033 RepID=A0ABW1KVI0_9PROT